VRRGVASRRVTWADGRDHPTCQPWYNEYFGIPIGWVARLRIDIDDRIHVRPPDRPDRMRGRRHSVSAAAGRTVTVGRTAALALLHLAHDLHARLPAAFWTASGEFDHARVVPRPSSRRRSETRSHADPKQPPDGPTTPCFPPISARTHRQDVKSFGTREHSSDDSRSALQAGVVGSSPISSTANAGFSAPRGPSRSRASA